ncbi:hypothetical protein MHYP_G00132210 [Metynnis hypsauchen]
MQNRPGKSESRWGLVEWAVMSRDQSPKLWLAAASIASPSAFPLTMRLHNITLISEQSGIITNSSAVRSVRRGSCRTSAGGNGLTAASRAPNDSTLLMQRGTELNGTEQAGQAHAELIYLSGKDEESPADESAVQRK